MALTRTASPRLRSFAAIPLIFAAQQASEGVVWLTVDDPSGTLNRVAANVFLGFALILWPIWAPLSLRRMEGDPGRKRLLTGFTIMGVVVAVVALAMLARWQPVSIVAGHSIRYDYAGANNAILSTVLLAGYVVPTVVPWFVSTSYLTRIIGITLAASLAVTYVVERDTLTSVWCFFAAVLSGQVVLAVMPRRPTLSVEPAR